MYFNQRMLIRLSQYNDGFTLKNKPYLIKNNPRIVAKSGHLSLVCLYYDQVCNHTVAWIAFYGHLHIIKWLHHNKCTHFSKFTIDWAANGGQLNVLQWLFFNRDERCTINALKYSSNYNIIDFIEDICPEFIGF
jgi:hypothetical protein